MITPAYSMTATERVLPRLALDFTTAALDPRVTVARALNTATCVNSSGFIETVNANLPRFDYSPITLQPRGLLIEESRINIRSFSEDFSNAVWAPTNLNQTGTPPWVNVATSPANTLTADKLIANTTNGTHRVVGGAQATSSGSRYAMSIFAKKSEYSKIAIGEFNNGVGWASFNLLTGAVIATGGTGSPTASIEPYRDDWFRCILTFAAGAFSRFDIYTLNDAYTNTEPSSYNFTGDNTSGVFIWGADLELGAFATSYIANLATGTTTRNADVVSMTGTNFSSWYNSSEGTFVANFIPYAAGSYTVFSATNNSFNNRIQGEASNAVQFLVGDGGAIQAFLDAGTITAGALSKIATSYKAGRFAVSLNSSALAQILSGTVPSVNRLDIGNLSGFAQFYNGWIPGLRYFPLSLTAAELQAFSK